MYERFKILLVLTSFFLILLGLSISGIQGQVKIDNNFFKKYLTQIKNPKLLTIDDIKRDYEKTGMEGWSFVIEGDFNKDGYTDCAIAGKYDGPYPDSSLSIAILSEKKAK